MTSSVSRLRTDLAVLAAQHYRLGEPTFREEAKEFARDVARRARENVERIIDVLAAAGYVFVHPDSVHRPPQDGKRHWLRELEEKGVYIPLILEAWMIAILSPCLVNSYIREQPRSPAKDQLRRHRYQIVRTGYRAIAGSEVTRIKPSAIA